MAVFDRFLWTLNRKIIDTWLQISQVLENVCEVLQVILGGTSVQIWHDIVSSICFKRNFHLVLCHDLIYKRRKLKGTANFVLWDSKIVKRLRRWRYDPVIIESTLCLVLGPSATLWRPFLKHCTLTNKAVGTIWRALSKPPQRRQDSDPHPLWLLVGIPTALGSYLTYSQCQAHPTLAEVTLFFFFIFLWLLRVSWLLVLMDVTRYFRYTVYISLTLNIYSQNDSITLSVRAPV